MFASSSIADHVRVKGFGPVSLPGVFLEAEILVYGLVKKGLRFGVERR